MNQKIAIYGLILAVVTLVTLICANFCPKADTMTSKRIILHHLASKDTTLFATARALNRPMSRSIRRNRGSTAFFGCAKSARTEASPYSNAPPPRLAAKLMFDGATGTSSRAACAADGPRGASSSRDRP